jgi:glutamate--cysteine ligase
MDDWSDHVTILFPDARVKRFIEMRGADGGPLDKIVALPAYWVGLLYDQGALDAAWDMVKSWTKDERDLLRNAVPKQGLQAAFRSGTVRDLARETLRIADAGLKARAVRDASGQDEARYLAPLHEIVASGQTASDRLLAKFHGAWGGKIEPIFTDELM